VWFVQQLCAPYKPGRGDFLLSFAGKQVVGNQGPVTYDVTQISARSPVLSRSVPPNSLINPANSPPGLLVMAMATEKRSGHAVARARRAAGRQQTCRPGAASR
jgi:hypothetical protein